MPDAHTGVALGLTTPQSFGVDHRSRDDMLERVRALGISALEVDARAIEAFLGVPPEPALLHPPDDGFETGLLPEEEEVFREELAISRATFEARVREWRVGTSLAPLDPIGRSIEAAGLHLILRWDDLAVLSDPELEVAFCMARALKARIIAAELTALGARRIGPVAERHQLRVGFHGQEGTRPEAFRDVLETAGPVGVSIDTGLWVAGGDGSPLPFLAACTDRITHVYLSDRSAGTGATMPFGRGDAPIREVLQTMRDRRWPFPAIVLVGASAVDEQGTADEITSAIQYCREALES
jgi:sugar phosphate isomerase/epimerase